MATFSTNQVRHFYVSNSLKSPHVVSTDASGSIAVKADTSKSHMYIEYMSPGGLTRSDMIDTKNIVSIKATDGNAMAYPLSRFKLTLDSTVNSGAPVAGQDYLLRVAFRNYVGLSEEDQYFKYGMVHAVTGMTASDFYKTLVLSLAKNFSRDAEGLLTFSLETGGTVADAVAGTPVVVTKDTVASTLSGTYTGIVIEEKPQPWTLGIFEQLSVNFTLQPDAIVASGDERIWGVVKKVTSTAKVENGKKIADLEYFCLGERGDIYRGIGFPNNIKTTYLVDPNVKYNLIDIQYAYQGSSEDIQKSQKVITLAVPKIGATNSISNVLTNTIITAINTASGASVPTLDISAT